MAGFKEVYKASVTFNDKTIQQVFRTEYFTYDRIKVLLRAVVGFALIAVAIFAGFNTAITVVLLLIGCWLFIALDFPSKVRAEGVIQRRKGMENTVHLRFGEIYIEVTEEKKQYKYTEIDRLVADKEYLFIFFSRQKALMLDVNTLEPKDASAFRNFVAEKSGKQWKTTSILFMNFRDLRQAIKDMKTR